MLSMRDSMSQCWHAFLQHAAAGVNEATEDEVLDFIATQAMEVDPLPCNLRRTPRGSDLHDLAEAEQRWTREERQVREWALAHPERWQTMPQGTGDD
eukprot:15483831-Alexandrium_andersonii.AAC.1